MSRLLAFFLVLLMFAACPAQAGDTHFDQFDRLIAQSKGEMATNPLAAIASAKLAERAAADLPTHHRISGLATAVWLQGEAFLRIDRNDKAGPLLKRASALLASQKSFSKLTGDVRLSLGWFHSARADVASALSDYQAAYRIYQRVNEPRSEAVALMAIAALYNSSSDFAHSLKYIDEARSVYKEDTSLTLSIYNTRGNVLRGLGRISAALREYKRGLMLARSSNSVQVEQTILWNLIRTYTETGQFNYAASYIAQYARIIKLHPSKERESQLLAASANLDLKQRRLSDGRVKLARALLLGSAGGVAFDRDFRETAYLIYKASGEPAKALLHLEALKAIDDKTAKLTASANTALMAARFDFANQELRIERLRRRDLQRSLELEHAHAQTQRIIFSGTAYAGLVILILLGVGLITIRRSRNEVRAANVDLAATNAALAKALAAKTEFLATTSHEIRTPLNGILGMTQVMLADRALDAETRDRVGVVHGAGLSMRALVDDILDVAKMETGNLTIELLPVDVIPLMRDVSRLWEEQALQRGLGFTLDVKDAPLRIVTDEARLRQVVFNLLSNAVKFTESGAISLRVATHGESEAAQLVIEVTDTGIGIPADKLDQIFEAFRQADAGTTRKFGGTGLGLAICRNIGRALGGDVRVVSQEGQGSSFELILPLVLADSAEQTAAGDALLIVDRNPISRAMLKTVLAGRAANIHCVGTLEDAAVFIARGGVSLVLVEGSALDSDPDVLMSFARPISTAGANLVVLWSRPDEETIAQLRAAGADMIIAKPIAGAALAAQLFDQPPRTLASAAA